MSPRLSQSLPPACLFGSHRCSGPQEGGTNAPKRHFYYNDQWRCIEERLGNGEPERHHVFHPHNRWHLLPDGRIEHANHFHDPLTFRQSVGIDPIPDEKMGDMKVYNSTAEKWAESNSDFNEEVWCAACETDKLKNV